ncbi:MAG TPA: isoprenylcysteine carboxylmethyltransferase family protein [Candidatus Acidoferrales bacterium]|nr:isoprenylcysteine carboxylmethyltransferase family protein [Candidatus Acidoferrales bacterium]
MTTRPTLGRRAAWAATYGERYVLSIVFLCLAAYRLHRLITASGAERAAIEAAPVSTIIPQVVLVQLYVYVGLLLLLGRRVTAPPQELRDILLPMGTTFFYLAYSAVPWFPAWLKHSLCPAPWQGACAATGLVLNLLGMWIAIWAAVYLGRSFGVLIEVRTVVLEGAYKWVRHPMYSGYVLFLAGFALANFSPAYLVLTPLHIGLLLYRARLEEARLAECSPQYGAYRRQTGFIFPRLYRR